MELIVNIHTPKTNIIFVLFLQVTISRRLES